MPLFARLHRVGLAGLALTALLAAVPHARAFPSIVVLHDVTFDDGLSRNYSTQSTQRAFGCRSEASDCIARRAMSASKGCERESPADPGRLP